MNPQATEYAVEYAVLPSLVGKLTLTAEGGHLTAVLFARAALMRLLRR
jgi:hypothetical protein